MFGDLSKDAYGLLAILSHGLASQDLVLHFVLPYASAVYEATSPLLYPIGLASVSILLLYYIVSPDSSLPRWFFSFVVIIVLLLPIEVSRSDSRMWMLSGGPVLSEEGVPGARDLVDRSYQYPWSIVFVFWAISIPERLLYESIQGTVNRVGSNSPINGLPIDSFSSAGAAKVNLIDSKELRRAYGDFLFNCNTNELTERERQALGIENPGILMNSNFVIGEKTSGGWSFFGSGMEVTIQQYKGAVDSGIQKLSQEAAVESDPNGLGFNLAGYRIPRKEVWHNEEAQTFVCSSSSDGPFTGCQEPPSRMKKPATKADPHPETNPGYNYTYYPRNCADLYQVVSEGFGAYGEAQRDRIKEERGRVQNFLRPIVDTFTPDSSMNDNTIEVPDADEVSARWENIMSGPHIKKVLSQANRQANGNFQGRLGEPGTSMSEDIIDSVAGGLKGGLFDWYTTLKSWHLEYSIVIALGLVSLGLGLLFIIAPVSLVFSALPFNFLGFGVLIQLIVFGKLVLALMYIILQVGSALYMFLIRDAAFTFQTDPASLMPTLALSMTIEFATIMGVIALAPMIAFLLVFRAPAGMASAEPGSASGAAASAGIRTAATAGLAAGAAGRLAGATQRSTSSVSALSSNEVRDPSAAAPGSRGVSNGPSVGGSGAGRSGAAGSGAPAHFDGDKGTTSTVTGRNEFANDRQSSIQRPSNITGTRDAKGRDETRDS